MEVVCGRQPPPCLEAYRSGKRLRKRQARCWRLSIFARRIIFRCFPGDSGPPSDSIESVTALPWSTKVFLRDNAVLNRTDHERHVAGEVREMVLASVAFLEFLEMHEGVVPGVQEE